jgi:DUF2934 family protein
MARQATQPAVDPAEAPQSHETTHLTVAKPVDHEEVAERAYELWQARGCPVGSGECDWFEAERELLGRTQEGQ